MSWLGLVCLLGCQTVERPVVSEAILSLGIIDGHNHDASGKKYLSSFPVWDRYGIAQVVLFGDISEPSAQQTDQISLQAAADHPHRIIPFVAGINIDDPNCIDYIKTNFAKGARGVGEIVARSLNSPVASRLLWKASGVDDPRLRKVYQVCGEYRRPLLLHIDPLNWAEVQSLLKVAKEFPETDFIVAHANAYSDIGDLEYLLQNTGNVTLDFFPGFSLFNPDSPSFHREVGSRLSEFIELMERFPERFVISSDSGFGVGYENAYRAMHILVSSLKPETAKKVASGNLLRLLSQATPGPRP